MEFVKKHAALVTGFVVFVFYFFTIAPGVIQIDSGEFSAVQATLGIAHPTGPLFTILDYLFLLIPLPCTRIFQANLLSAIFCSMGIVYFVKPSMIALDNGANDFILKRSIKRKKDAEKYKTVSISENKLND